MSRKIYFAGSIHGGRQDAELYFRIIEQLKGYGTVFTEHVGHPNHPELAGMNEKEVHDGHIDDWLQKSDVLVAECTQPSLGVGYEIGRAVAMNKNIFVLFRPDAGRKLSCMIRGAQNGSTFIVKDYKEEELPGLLKNYFGSKT